MKVVITGANGFIGKYLAKKTVELGWETVLVVRPGRVDFLPSNVNIVTLSLEEYQHIGKLVGFCDCFFHLAWAGTRGASRMDAELQNKNLKYSMQGMHSMIQAGCRRIVTGGSQAEYGLCGNKITEETLCNPNTAYGIAKLLLCQELADLCEQNGVEYRVPRIFSLYGPGDFSGTMILSILRDMLANRPCRLTECRQMWDYLYIDDAVEGLIRLCKDPCPDGVYNFGSGDARPLREYVEDMARLTQTKSELLYGAVPYPPAGMVSIWPDVSKLKRELHWEPRVSFEEGIRSILSSITVGSNHP